MNAIDFVATGRSDLAGLLDDIERLDMVVAEWDESQRGVMAAQRRALEALHAEALRRLLRVLKGEPAALEALKRAAADEIVYAVLRRHNLLKPSLAERVETALAGIRPMLAGHGGDVELVAVTPPSVTVRFVGACDHCPASALTFSEGVRKAIQDACPEIAEVLQARGAAAGTVTETVDLVSPFARTEPGWVAVGDLADIPEQGVLAVSGAGSGLILSRIGHLVTCFENACAHLGMALDGGDVADGILTCPWHGFRYDLASGECLTAPQVQLAPVPVRVRGQRVEVRTGA